MVWCASGESDPKDIALATKVRAMVSGAAISSSESSGPAGRDLEQVAEVRGLGFDGLCGEGSEGREGERGTLLGGSNDRLQ